MAKEFSQLSSLSRNGPLGPTDHVQRWSHGEHIYTDYFKCNNVINEIKLIGFCTIA